MRVATLRAVWAAYSTPGRHTIRQVATLTGLCKATVVVARHHLLGCGYLAPGEGNATTVARIPLIEVRE